MPRLPTLYVVLQDDNAAVRRFFFVKSNDFFQQVLLLFRRNNAHRAHRIQTDWLILARRIYVVIASLVFRFVDSKFIGALFSQNLHDF